MGWVSAPLAAELGATLNGMTADEITALNRSPLGGRAGAH